MTNTSKAQFAHLHSHTDHSVLDGHASVKELAAHVHASGQPGYAVTDHGTMSNVYNAVAAAEAISKATGDDFRCMPGIEAYVVPGDASRHTREPIFFSNASHSRENKEERSNDVSGGGAYTHMTMLAETSEGMHNLFRLNTLAWHEGIHRKPRMDIQSISEYSKGVIATTGCPSGELQTRLRLGQWKEAIAYAAKMQDIFGKDNYYLELMDHNMSIDLERRVRGDLMKVASELRIPLLATNDLHYVKREDAQDHEHMLCIQSGSSMLDQPYDLGGKRFAFEGEEYYAKTADEMLRLFPQDQYPDAVQNAANIVKRSSAKFEYNPELRPSVPLPDGHDEHSFLREMVYNGLKRKRPDKVSDQEYIDRIEKELGVLREKNFSGYVLVVSDFMRWAKAQGWHCGPGRGCLDGSTMIPTTMGHKRLDEVQVGDKAYDQSGDIIEVPAVFEWDCDEELIEISTYYGGAPLKMTSDHKVLVSKANRVTSKTKITRGYVFEKEPLPLEWVRADEIEVGDLVVSPKLKVEEEFTGIDIEPVSIAVANIASPLSVRSIVRETNLARSTVMRFFKGEKLGEDTKVKIQSYLNDHNSTIEDAIAIRTKTSVLDLEDTFIPANHDLGFVMGLFISDGWFRSKGHEIGFAQNRSEDEGIIPDVFKRVFGTDLISADHASSDLRQYRTSNQGVVAVFKDLFPDYAFTAQSKYIPAILMNSNEEFRRGLLEGLWYGDGCFSGKTVYSTVSRRLAYGVHGLLGTLGIHSGITENVRRESRPEFNVAGRDSYTEYKVISAQEFDETRVINGMGIPYNGEFMYNRVRKIGTVPSSGKVYDFRVDTTNSYATESFVVHNSGGGSLVAFFTDIVEIDPIPHGLIFERFLNPERDSMPDFDSDFDDVNREKVIEYVRQKYGEEMVAMIITFGVIKAKSAIKDIARIYEEPFSVGETLTKALPAPIAGKEISLKEIFDKNAARYAEAEQFREEARKIDNKNLIPFALGIEGKMRQTGVHAAGVIMSGKPLKDSIPLMMRAKDNMTITQFDYPTCEDLGLIKMDFLGLRNLTVIDKAINAIERNHGIKLIPQEIYDSVLTNPDQMTFDIINAGRTLGIFQLDSVAIAALARLIHVTSFNDISAILALYRPGPMGMESHTKYADRKNGREEITPIHPDLAEILEPILGETFGLCVAGDTEIWDAKKGNIVRIDSIEDAVKDGDFYTFSMAEDGSFVPKKVSHWFHTGRKAIHEVKLKDGRKLRMSAEHPVLTVDGWKKTEDLVVTDRLATSKTEFSPIEKSTTSIEEARLIGYLLGDGYVTAKYNAFTNSDPEITEHVSELAQGLFEDCHINHVPRSREGRVYTTHTYFTSSPYGVGKGNGKRNSYASFGLNRWLHESMGVSEKVLSDKKKVPDAILSADIEAVKNFLAALWDCDGSINHRSSYLKTISSELAHGVQYLLDRCGIHASVLDTGSYESIRGARNTYGVYVHGVKFWNDIVPLMKHAQKKEEKYSFTGTTKFEGISYTSLQGTMKSLISNDETLPHWIRKRFKAEGVFPGRGSIESYFLRNGITVEGAARTKSPFLKDGFIPMGSTVKAYLAHAGTMEDMRNANLYWNLIESIEIVSEEDVYDITVEDNHNFLANGVVVHNCVFQEQIQFVAQKVAGYSLGQADILRRAMGKKKKSILDAEFIPFSEGMKKNGYKDEAIQALWDTLVPFAEYGFNKSHSSAYALLSYLTAYLKAHYGPEFMAANLSTLTGDKDKTASYLAECRHMGITVLPPDVSRSTADYTATPEGTILVGLEAIRGVGHEVSNSIFREAAENGEFQTLDDFMSRAPYSALSKGVLEGLSHSGALDRFGFSRRALHTYLPDAAKGFAQSKKKQDVGQFSLFDMVEEADAPSVAITDMPEYVKKDKLMFERHALGLYVSDHPLSGIANMLERFSDTQVADVISGAVKPAASFGDRQTLRFAGVANNVIKKQTRAGGMFGTFELEDITGSIPCLIFPKAFERLGHRVEPDNIYMVTGQLLAGDGEDDVKFAVNDIEEIELTESGLIPFNINIRLSQAHEDALQELERLLRSYPGEMPVYLNVTNSKGELQIFELGDEFRVASSKTLLREVQNLFGFNAV